MLGRERRQSAPVAEPAAERTLEVTASMQGSLSFKDPVNLRISGRFEGTLDTLGSLTIGDRAQVDAQITGETIVVAGRAQGKIVAKRSLRLIPPARVTGEIWTPRLSVEEGAWLDGAVHMTQPSAASGEWLSIEEVAQYLEVEPTVVQQWAAQGRMPSVKDGENWRFERTRLDQWVAAERAK